MEKSITSKLIRVFLVVALAMQLVACGKSTSSKTSEVDENIPEGFEAAGEPLVISADELKGDNDADEEDIEDGSESSDSREETEPEIDEAYPEEAKVIGDTEADVASASDREAEYGVTETDWTTGYFRINNFEGYIRDITFSDIEACGFKKDGKSLVDDALESGYYASVSSLTNGDKFSSYGAISCTVQNYSEEDKKLGDCPVSKVEMSIYKWTDDTTDFFSIGNGIYVGMQMDEARKLVGTELEVDYEGSQYTIETCTVNDMKLSIEYEPATGIVTELELRDMA